MKCAFCDSDTAELIALDVSIAKGLPFDAIRVLACTEHTSKGFESAIDQLDEQISDLRRRRAILRLNLELEELITSDAPAEKIKANRDQKTALVLLKKLGSAAAIASALEALS